LPAARRVNRYEQGVETSRRGARRHRAAALGLGASGASLPRVAAA